MNKIKYHNQLKKNDKKTPNKTTQKAMKEAEDIKKHPEKYKSYTDIDELIKDALA